MRTKHSTLAAAITAALALGVAAPAAASVYATSSLEIQDLVISISPTATPTTFNFNLNNTASLNNVAVIEQNSCNGAFTAGLLTSTSCNAGVPRLDAQPANAPGGDVTRANNVFNFFGPGAGQYSNSDSVIYTAQLLGDGSTNSQQIAESALTSGFQAAASAQIQSTTGFVFSFDVVGGGMLSLEFLADPFMRALIAQPTAGNYAAQADMAATFRLQDNNNPGRFVTWAPDGSGLSCVAVGGPVCTVINDSESLNTTIGTTTNNTSVSHSAVGALNPFGIGVTGLTDGNWTLTLSALTSTLLTSRPTQVPEPGMLALLGIGLAGLGAIRRRRIV
jgi:hypothetical protein